MPLNLFWPVMVVEPSWSVLENAFGFFVCIVPSFVFFFFAFVALFDAKTNTVCSFPRRNVTSVMYKFAKSYCKLGETHPPKITIGQVSESYREESFQYNHQCRYFMYAAFAFMLPKIIWNLSQYFANTSIFSICKKVLRLKIPWESREEKELIFKKMTKKIDIFLQNDSMFKIRPFIVYSVVKILNLVISFLQLLVLSFFLGNNNIFGEFELFKTIRKEITWKKIGMFPNISFCNFTVRAEEASGQFRYETIQCFLKRNSNKDVMFVLIWVWLLLNFFVVGLGNVFTFNYFYKKKSTRTNLTLIFEEEGNHQNILLDKFLHEYLKCDGQLILLFVQKLSDTIADELAIELWKLYKKRVGKDIVFKCDTHHEETDMNDNCIFMADVDLDIKMGDKEEQW